MRVLAVVPALNEEQSVPLLIEELHATFAELGLEGETVVIDDGSSDRTAARALAARARVVRLCRNLGIGGAVQTGIRLALRENFDCAVQIDGDGQHPPGELKKLLAPLLQDAVPDLIVGTRYVEREGFTSTPMRRLGSRWLRAVLRWVTGMSFTDPTSGYRVYGPRALSLFERTYPYDYPEPEALAIARVSSLRILEVPVRMRERQGGKSSIGGLGPLYYMLKVTLAVLLTYLRNAKTRSAPSPHG